MLLCSVLRLLASSKLIHACFVQEHGVGLFQELSWRDLVTECDSILYLVRPSALLMKQIAKQVSSLVSQRVSVSVPFCALRVIGVHGVTFDCGCAASEGYPRPFRAAPHRQVREDSTGRDDWHPGARV